MDDADDCLVIGGGPAGLTAAIYLGRFRRRVRLYDTGSSRVGWIKRSHNLPGFPDGVPGADLLKALRMQAETYGARLQTGTVTALTRGPDGGFLADTPEGPIEARTVILAAGVVEIEPPLPDVTDAVKRGLIRICPICDGFEGIDKPIGVMGSGDHAASEALFLRTYTGRLSILLPDGADQPSSDMLERLKAAGIGVHRVRVGAIRLENACVTVPALEDGEEHLFHAIYSAFGTRPQSGLAVGLGAKVDRDGRIFVDAHQETSAEGLFAAGDLVRGLNQISVANGEAAIAATAIHNRLPQRMA